MATKGEVKKDLGEKARLILVIYKESLLTTHELAGNISSIVLSLLQEFDDVFPEEVPDGLPPLRGIEHHIDFIPGAPLSNQLVTTMYFACFVAAF